MPFAAARPKTREASATVEIADVDVGHSRIAAIRFARRPAHQLYTRVAGSLAEGEYFLKRKLGHDGAHKTKLHDPRFYCDGRAVVSLIQFRNPSEPLGSLSEQ